MCSDCSVEKEKYPKFKLSNLVFPSLYSFFSSHDISGHMVTHRVEATIIDDKKLHVVFGVNIRSRDTVEIDGQSQPKTNVLVEALGTFEFEEEIPKVKKIQDIPLAANLLALMYPFIREKINYCFGANNIQFFLGPINLFALLKEYSNKKNTSVNDQRSLP